MTVIFAFLAGAVGLMLRGRRSLAIGLIAAAFVLACGIAFFHMDSTLNINW